MLAAARISMLRKWIRNDPRADCTAEFAESAPHPLCRRQCVDTTRAIGTVISPCAAHPGPRTPPEVSALVKYSRARFAVTPDHGYTYPIRSGRRVLDKFKLRSWKPFVTHSLVSQLAITRRWF